MTCNHCQSLIDSYIENTIPEEEYEAFIDHVYSCEKCMDELKLSYSLLTALNQLENGLELSEDYDNEVEEKITRHIERRKRKKVLRFVSATLLLIISIVVGFLYSFFFIKKENINYNEDKSSSYFVFTVNGVPESMDPVKLELKKLNDGAVDYIHSLNTDNNK